MKSRGRLIHSSLMPSVARLHLFPALPSSCARLPRGLKRLPCTSHHICSSSSSTREKGRNARYPCQLYRPSLKSLPRSPTQHPHVHVSDQEPVVTPWSKDGRKNSLLIRGGTSAAEARAVSLRREAMPSPRCLAQTGPAATPQAPEERRVAARLSPGGCRPGAGGFADMAGEPRC